MTRLAALGERLETPLLVTNLTNVFYLCGFDSSNAALLVQPRGETTLYTDFRYAEAAQAVDGVTVSMTKRALTVDVGEQLTGTVQFEADVLVMGDDWAGKFDEFGDVCRVEYLPRTPAISTTALIEKISTGP